MESVPDASHPITSPEDTALQARLAQSARVLSGWIERPPAGDMYIADYAQAIFPYQFKGGPIYDTVCALLQERPDIGASHLENLKLRALQKQLISLFGDTYPACLRNPRDWDVAIQQVLDDPERIEEWRYDMHHRDLQTNDPNRGGNLKVFLSIANRLGRISSGNMVEIGCSQNLIFKGIARQAQHGFSEAVKHFGRNESAIPLPHVMQPGGGISQAYTYAYQKLLQEPVPAGELIGIDRIDPATSRNWTLLSLYPSEHEDKERLRYMRELAYTDYENVHFYHADFDEIDPEVLMRRFNVDDIESTFGWTSFYQSAPAVRASMTEKAIAMSKEFVLVQDNCVVSAQDPTKLIFPSDWQSVPYCYRTYVWDKRARNPEWQELFMSPNSRAHTLRIGPAEIVDCYGDSVRAWDVIDTVT